MAILAALLVFTAGCASDVDEAPSPPSACSAPAPSLPLAESEAPPDRVSEERLRAWIDLLASPELDGRRAGTGDTAPVIDALVGYLGTLGTPVLCQDFQVLGRRETNVLLRLGGGGPPLLLAAHYDGQGRHPTRGPLPGADDNASGVAALLEVARLLARSPPDRTAVWIAFLGAEEVGRVGARRLGHAPPWTTTPRAALVIDMVGRRPPEGGFFFRLAPGTSEDGPSYSGASGSDAPEESTERPAILRRLREAADDGRLSSVETLPPERRPGAADDQALAANRIPSLLLTTGLHDDHHGPGDVPEAVDTGQVARAAQLALAWVGHHDGDDGDDGDDAVPPPRRP